MNLSQINTKNPVWKIFLIAAAVLFVFGMVLVKLGRNWWTDENYSHGLLVPFVIGYIVWLDFENLRNVEKRAEPRFGFAIILVSLLMLLSGTLGAELFTQRVSFVLVLAGIIVYFLGTGVLQKLVVPFALLLLAIPIPQIIFNKIAFPLQIWASQIAVWGVELFEIPSVRNGNVIKLVPRGTTRVVGLEVVEACSGIRSLMTLMTLALILAYFTRERRQRMVNAWFDFLRNFDFWRTVILMLSAVPIALLTNAARVTTNGVLTYYYGEQIVMGFWHDLSGWLVFVLGFVLLTFANFVLNKFHCRDREAAAQDTNHEPTANHQGHVTSYQTFVLLIALFIGGVFINWFEQRGELPIERLTLNQLSSELGEWQQKGHDTRFSAEEESVLRASDYVMRNYLLPTGRRANLYISYYVSQRTGATYHSPLNCLPGSGWEMKSPELVEIRTLAGKTFTVNRYIVQNGNYRAVLIYWYQGRGRTTTNEYQDKVYTILDSILRRRSDGAMVRVMTPVGENEAESLQAAVDFSSIVADRITPFVPD